VKVDSCPRVISECRPLLCTERPLGELTLQRLGDFGLWRNNIQRGKIGKGPKMLSCVEPARL
jgi:hypothetical protein